MITILCSGSQGDIQPYIALALEIKKQGSDVQIVTGNSFKDYIEGYGIKFLPVSADYKTLDIDPKFMEQARSSDNPLKMLMVFNKMKKYGTSITEEMYDLCQGSDVIVYHPGCTVAYYAAKDMGIPCVLASPFPMHTTDQVASVIAYGRFNLPNKLTYKLLQTMLWTASKTNLVSFIKKRFGKLPKGFGCPFEWIDSTHPAIVSCSNHIFSRPTDWNKNIHQSGYWFVKEQQEYIPDKELSDFLKAGDKPIYFGFGSVFSQNDKGQLIPIIINALQSTGRRGIISGMGQIDNLPDNIHCIESVPHTWLFENVSAVCHHGGAGTSAAGFRAGVPSMIMPFSNDQFAWAHRAYDLGVGSKPLNRKKLTAENLIEAIEYAHKSNIVKKAKVLGEKISQENGLTACAQIIINLAGTKV